MLTSPWNACLLCVAPLVLAAGCGPGRAENGGGTALVHVEEEPAGQNCTAGGSRILTGVDTDADGKLTGTEVQQTQFVCNGTAGQDGEDGSTSLVSVETEPPGANCPAGGQALRHGVDADADGVLDTEEVQVTRYVCNGRNGDGLNSLVQVAAEGPGANCAHGGQSIRTGMDDNSDGLLQPEEVDSTVFVCNGAAGSDGSTSLVRQDDEPAGNNCPHGGIVVFNGVDANQSGQLDGDETTSTSYVCHGAPGAPGGTSLFAISPEPAGEACPFAGNRLDTGLDDDGDGVLSAAEVDATRFICHGERGASGAAALVHTSADASGCAGTDGVRVDSGLDDNGDGTLAPDEVDQSRWVCSGATTLVNTTPEPAGTNCAQGGQRVDSGVDADGSGALDAPEITDTGFVCNGGSLQVRATNAPWGGVCTFGGVRVETGVDDDGDGTLDTTEVDATQHVCNIVPVHAETGRFHSCAIMSDASVRCWGRNHRGQLGDGTQVERPFPVPVQSLGPPVGRPVAALSLGGAHSCALLVNASVLCWGDNTNGQLGIASTSTIRTAPTVLTSLSGIRQISAGTNHTCARTGQDRVRCWGLNTNGQVGDGTTTLRRAPVELSLPYVRDISAGASHTCAADAYQHSWCWGYNSYGAVGDNTQTQRLTPTRTYGLNSVVDVSAGSGFACARLTDGSVYCWGINSYNQLGDGTDTVDYRLTPTKALYLDDATSLNCGVSASCSLTEAGRIECWGVGPTGTGTSPHPYPALVSAHGLTQVSVRGSHACGMDVAAQVRCWGNGSYGQLGRGGSGDQQDLPEPVVFHVAP